VTTARPHHRYAREQNGDPAPQTLFGGLFGGLFGCLGSQPRFGVAEHDTPYIRCDSTFVVYCRRLIHPSSPNQR